MAKADSPLKVEIPRPADEQPVWTRVGAIGAFGFLIGIAWPKVLGVKIGPNVPGDTRATAEAVVKAPPASSGAKAAAAASAEPAAEKPKPENQQRVVVGLPVHLSGEEGAQAALARAFASELDEILEVAVDTYDERLTSRMADTSRREGAGASRDSIAAAHLLEAYLMTLASPFWRGVMR